MTDEVYKHTHAVPFVAFGAKGGRIVVFADEEATTTLRVPHIVGVEPQRARSRGRQAK